MERSEPALVPGWLKGTSGGATGSNLPHFAASLQSDDPSIVLPARSRLSISSNDHDTPRSSTSADRTASAYFRRSSSSNGQVMHDRDFRSYSSFGRNLRDRDREKDLDYHFGDHDYSDSLIIGKDSLRRSKSMISTKRDEFFPRRVGNGANNDSLIGRGITSNIHKATFQRDFPSLGAEEKRVPEVGRISPPILSTATQSLPMGSSSLIGNDMWTSALVEIPVPVASNNVSIPSAQQTNPVNMSSVTPSASTGLNMAETLAQVPSRARNVPQLSAETQRLEELAIKQSRQLIPVTPSMPKTLALISSEKPKTKASRSGDLSIAAKVGSQSQLGNHTLRVTARSDLSKTTQIGKLQVLKATREMNGMSPTAKESTSPTNATKPSPGVSPSATSATLKSPNNAKLTADHKSSASPVIQSTTVDRRLPSQARHDFFNSLRKKTSANHLAAAPDARLTGATISEKSDEQAGACCASVSEEEKDAPTLASDLHCSNENSSRTVADVDASKELEGSPFGGKNSGSDAIAGLDEEVKFLKSLGWEENSGEEGGLTEEEINSFYQECIKKCPSSKLCRVMQQSKMLQLGFQNGNFGSASSELSSSNP